VSASSQAPPLDRCQTAVVVFGGSNQVGERGAVAHAVALAARSISAGSALTSAVSAPRRLLTSAIRPRRSVEDDRSRFWRRLSCAATPEHARGKGKEQQSIVAGLDSQIGVDSRDLLKGLEEIEPELPDLGVVAAEHLLEDLPGYRLRSVDAQCPK
jgi:hypothetical protein